MSRLICPPSSGQTGNRLTNPHNRLIKIRARTVKYPMKLALIIRTKPSGCSVCKPNARFAVFHCADDLDNSRDGSGQYYESIDLIDAFHPQTILAYAMNGAPLEIKHGAPLRLRVERQLGYKQAKYVMRIEIVERLDKIRRGKGGYWEDRGYEWYAGI